MVTGLNLVGCHGAHTEELPLTVTFISLSDRKAFIQRNTFPLIPVEKCKAMHIGYNKYGCQSNHLRPDNSCSNQPTGGDCAARCKHIKSDNAKAGSVLLIHTNSRKHDAYAEKN